VVGLGIPATGSRPGSEAEVSTTVGVSLGFGVASKTSSIGMIERRLGRELHSLASYTG